MKFIKPSFEILDIPEPNDHMGVLSLNILHAQR